MRRGALFCRRGRRDNWLKSTALKEPRSIISFPSVPFIRFVRRRLMDSVERAQCRQLWVFLTKVRFQFMHGRRSALSNRSLLSANNADQKVDLPVRTAKWKRDISSASFDGNHRRAND